MNTAPAERLSPITDREFCLISDLVYREFGIRLAKKKKKLVWGRLNNLICSLGFSNFEEYYHSIITDKSKRSLLPLIDKISTNHSFFFREKDHFEYLISTLLPLICGDPKDPKRNRLRIWCAGCAAGEEPYTLAMVLLEYFGSWACQADLKILATDISLSALNKALKGTYQYENIKMLPKYLRLKYLKKNRQRDSYTVDKRLKKMILFKKLNLMRDTYPFKGRFDLVFCRNVIIYFDHDTMQKLIVNLHRYMHGNSYLFIGHSESLKTKTNRFKYIRSAVYKRC